MDTSAQHQPASITKPVVVAHHAATGPAFRVYVDGLDYKGIGSRHGLEHANDLRTGSTFTVCPGETIHDALVRHRREWDARAAETAQTLEL